MKPNMLCIIHYDSDKHKVTVTEMGLRLDIVVEEIQVQEQLQLPFQWKSGLPPCARNDHWM